MRMLPRIYLRGVLVLCLGGAIGWSLFRPQAAPMHPLDQMVPEGSLLYIEAKDFSSLLKDWTSSPEHANWLKSDNYHIFSKSRLFLRLNEASDQFAAAAGLPPNMKFLQQTSGKESVLAVYDIGNLELLYISRLSGEFLQSELWQSRNKFQPRSAGGKEFFSRKDPTSGRIVAFAVADNYLVLGTREELVGGALELMAGHKGRTLREEGWYAQTLASTQASPGDLRMVMNLEKIAITPHFRTYWVQQNITEMQSYTSAISDLYREGTVYREERIILPKKQADEKVIAESAQAVTSLLGYIPKDYGFYQASSADSKRSLAILEQKILGGHFSAGPAGTLAPQVQLTSGTTGAGTDLETRIDVEPASRVTNLNPAEALRQQIEKASPQAMLIVQATHKEHDGVFMNMPAAVAITGATDWDGPALQRAVADVVSPAVTASRLGVQWRDVKDAGGYVELDGLAPVRMAVRGKTVFFSNDAALLVSVLTAKGQVPSQPAAYAAGFSHSRERRNFYKFSTLVDQQSRATEAEPQFFSQNAASFSQSFARVDAEEIITHQTKDRIQQTVTYRWMP